jgi:hypothetical protein
MTENKTKATQASVSSFIKSLPAHRRADAEALVKLMQSVSREKPKLWGSSIIGFGSCHYRYDSGREGDMPLICFSPRKSANVVYNIGSAEKSRLERLGKHALSGKLFTHRKALGCRSQSSKDAGREIVCEGACATCKVSATFGQGTHQPSSYFGITWL